MCNHIKAATLGRLRQAVVLVALLLLAIPGAVAKGRIDTIAIDSRFIEAPARALVAVPEAHDTSRRAYPTVYLLHGYSGTYTDWSKKAPLDCLADSFGIVIVCPDGRDSWYWDSPVNPQMQMESYLVDELVPYIDEHYNTAREASQRAVTGLSMGGQGALWLGMRHPDVFRNVGSMSGGLDNTKFPDRWKMHRSLGRYAEYPQRWKTHSLMTLVQDLRPGELNIIFDCGSEDFFFEVNNAMDREMTRLGIPHTYSTRPGTHSWDYWTASLPAHLAFFTECFTHPDNPE